VRSMIDRVGPHAGLRTGRGWRPCSALWRLCSRSAEISGDKKLGCRGQLSVVAGARNHLDLLLVARNARSCGRTLAY
jgi:hypothetical protein